ncbi:hypothetical protein GOODEAATRI_031364 [Goodea atripinnis]|uniref:Uncharacterized protein n=1 Tax=Goodea atripinnis TaxID=208336 RepID=A0ABV0NZ75_9TELE
MRASAKCCHHVASDLRSSNTSLWIEGGLALVYMLRSLSDLQPDSQTPCMCQSMNPRIVLITLRSKILEKESKWIYTTVPQHWLNSEICFHCKVPSSLNICASINTRCIKLGVSQCEDQVCFRVCVIHRHG